MSIDAIALIDEEAERLSSALAALDPAQQVPTCPEWTAADLLWHLTEVHEFWARILTERATTDTEAMAIEESIPPRPQQQHELLERRAAATQALLAQLSSRAADEPAWFWYSRERTVGATRRMQVHEATIHRVDAELTAGRPLSPISPVVSAAGLEHVLQVMWPAGFEWIPEWASTRPMAAIEIRPDGGETRLLGISRWVGTRPRDGETFDVPVARVLDDPAEAGGLPRATASGTPLALNLWAWGRAAGLEHLPEGPDTVGIHGDDEAITQLRALIAEGHD